MAINSVPGYLEMCTEWLRDKTLESQPAQTYNADTWASSFPLPSLESVLKNYPKSITRSNVVDLGKLVHQSSIERKALECFFWSVMLWGWSNAGNGPERVRRIIEAAEPYDLLAEAFRYVQKSDIATAYQTFRDKKSTKIKHFDEAFFTKFLYFAGLGCGLQQYPLILDKKVIAGLKSLLGDKAPKEHRREDYLAYVEMMHDWAKLLGCRADSIEYLLYMVPAEFWRK